MRWLPKRLRLAIEGRGEGGDLVRIEPVLLITPAGYGLSGHANSVGDLLIR
jgi:hypothetical protein